MNVENLIFLSGVFFLVLLIYMDSIAWRLFPAFGKLRENVSSYLGDKLKNDDCVLVADIQEEPVDWAKVILSTFLINEVQDEIDSAVASAFEAFLFVTVISGLSAGIAWSVGILDIQLWSLAATVFGGSEIFAILLFSYRLRFLHAKVRTLMQIVR